MWAWLARATECRVLRSCPAVVSTGFATESTARSTSTSRTVLEGSVVPTFRKRSERWGTPLLFRTQIQSLRSDCGRDDRILRCGSESPPSRTEREKGGATVIFQHVVPIFRPYERRRRRSGAKVQIGCNDLQGADLSAGWPTYAGTILTEDAPRAARFGGWAKGNCTARHVPSRGFPRRRFQIGVFLSSLRDSVPLCVCFRSAEALGYFLSPLRGFVERSRVRSHG